VDLPKAANIPTKTKPENITISVDTAGNVYWNGALVTDRDILIQKVAVEAVKDPQPEVHIRGDRAAHYEAIGRTLYDVQRGGIIKIGFITEPDRGLGR
jgi:biopolymer transport protein ExbD